MPKGRHAISLDDNRLTIDTTKLANDVCNASCDLEFVRIRGCCTVASRKNPDESGGTEKAVLVAYGRLVGAKGNLSQIFVFS